MDQDVMQQLAGASGPLAPQQPAPPPQAGQPPQGAPSMDIPKLEAEESGILKQEADVSKQAAASDQQMMQQLQGMKPPQQNTKIMEMAPLMIGLVALGGRLTGIHAKVMLGATNGMVQGLLQGSEKAFNDANKQYEDARNKLFDMWKLQQNYYNQMLRSYGDMADAKERAIKVARELTNDQWTHNYKEEQQHMQQGMDELKSWYQQQSIMERFAALDERRNADEMRNQIAEMKNQISGRDVDSKVAQRQQQVQQKMQSKDTTLKDIDGMIKDVNIQMTALKRKYSDIETMSAEDKKQYDSLLQEMGQLEVSRKLRTPIPVSDPSELESLESGQYYQTPDGAIRINGAGGASQGGEEAQGQPAQGAPNAVPAQ